MIKKNNLTTAQRKKANRKHASGQLSMIKDIKGRKRKPE